MQKFMKKVYKEYDTRKFELHSKEIIASSAVRIYLFFKKRLK